MNNKNKLKEREIIYYDLFLKKYKSFFPFKPENINRSLNKNWIFEKFKKQELNKNYSFKCLNKFKKRNLTSNSFFEIKIDEKIFYIWFDRATYDYGGTKHGIKTSIPNNAKIFREKFLEKRNLKNVYFIIINIFNLYKFEKQEYKINDDDFIWLLTIEKEIYNTKTNNTKNGSNRWSNVSELKELLNSNNNYKINKKQTVYVIKKNNLLDIILDDDFLNFGKNIEKYLNNKNDEINKELEKKLRNVFRKNLLNQKGNQLINSNLSEKDFFELLVASHIWPVSEIKKSNLTFEDKKFAIKDINNGILIPYYLDTLFDKNFITFDSKLNLLVPRKIDKILLKELLIHINHNNIILKNIDLKKSKKYFEKHRQKTYEKWNNEIIKWNFEE